MPTRKLAQSLAWIRVFARRAWWYVRPAVARVALALVLRTDPVAEAGEGVISTAIVVVIMAFLAVGLWFAFKTIMANATTTVSNQVAQLGS